MPKLFRIGHLGDINDVTLFGTLAGIEMGLHLAGVPINPVVYMRQWIVLNRIGNKFPKRRKIAFFQSI